MQTVSLNEDCIIECRMYHLMQTVSLNVDCIN